MRPTDTSKRNREIIAAREGGETLASIGKRFGLTRARVQQICSHGPTRPPIDYAARDKEIRELFATGTSAAALARRHGITPQRIKQIIQERKPMKSSKRPPVSEADGKDVASLLEEAIKETGLNQYQLAKRLAALRPCQVCGGHGDVVGPRGGVTVCLSCRGTGQSQLSSQDQAVRRIRRLGQLPGEDVARDLARAFAPELDLPDDYFFQARSVGNLREALQDALAQIGELQKRVESLEKALERQKPAAPKRQGSTKRRRASQ
jgi:ribosome-binding protein aMBF1 (putative translation factor)